MESSGSDLMVFFSAFVDARCDVPFSEGKRRMSSAKSFIITNKSRRAVTVKHFCCMYPSMSLNLVQSVFE